MSGTAHENSSSPAPPENNGWRQRYWKKNLRLKIVLLAIWFTVSLGCGVLLVEPLNNIVILGFPLGLWFAQQGAIYTFVILILVYALWMDRLDTQFGLSEHDPHGGDES
ncbi:DUF4212 domain-containing protein [Auritidibacter ignavus]|uniref:DUF4212 domain-containing protein n=1 Tax=Auritidibacter ignavus TaxID=678932 RepID=UPI00244B0F8B|nr:DUF4212 domain-containing protein [Auritidibacter ignavus]WGH82932.1 DUF4212 domain-containing protein [Auritidibacter ignavus]